GAQPKARVELKADKFVLLHRVDRRLQASGNAQLELGPQLLQLDGQFGIDEGLFDFSRGNAPSLDDDVTVLRPEQSRAEAAPAAKASERKTRVNLAIDLGQRLRVRGYGLDSRLRGELKLAQSEKGLSLTGGVRAVDGTYAAYGQKLEVETGELSFVGPYDNPRLNVLAVRPNTDIRVGVKVTGTALSPRIALYSDPDMADTDKLSWLLLGRAPDSLGRADTALLQRAAMALISGDGESSSGKLLKNIGLDELSVSQGEDETRGAIVHLGKQITRRWYVGYERGLNETTGSWQLIYRLAQRFTIRAQTGEDNALDVIWQWKWE
ncbi:MAG: translocation/assembly module TamB domain-containing protein, partial [Burkholderiaceae bacterium]